MAGVERIHFKINGSEHSVGCEVSSDVSLLDYIRDTADLRGTKYMCREGGCGACIISAVTTPGAAPMSVNSCMVSVTSCYNWEVTTIEKVGNRLDGYHPIQKTLAEMNGTQCGYCTPGWIMAMYSLVQSKKHLTMLEIEKSFASNICRCTGYRPILEAFKKFAKDGPNYQEIADIEDLHICDKTGKTCKNKCTTDENYCCIVNKDNCNVSKVQEILFKDGKQWFRVLEINHIFKVLKERGDDSYMFIIGNTAKGAYPIIQYPRILIDISGIIELKGYKIDQNLIIGAGTTLTEFINICEQLSKEIYFEYLDKFSDHLNLVAHIAVRNIASIAGNLMIKHQHNDFPSDVFLLLETVGACVTICMYNFKENKDGSGVIAIYTAKDIPGLNAFTPINPLNIINEEVLCSGQVKYYNQPIAIIVAETRAIADRASKMVTVTYDEFKRPFIDIKDTKKDPIKTQFYKSNDANDKGNDIRKVFKHSNTIYGQYHFTMETLVCITRPVEDCLQVYSTSQWLDSLQQMISKALNIDQNRIDVYVRRLGGGYGFKISRNTQVAVACSLVAFKLNRPCRFIQSLTTNTKAMGKRFPCSADFEIGVNNAGIVQYMNFDIFEDNGYTVNELIANLGVKIFNTCYDASRWNYKCYQGTTDTAKNTYCRSPGTLETIAMVEGVMERISYEVSLDPSEVRLSNLDLKNHSDIKEMLQNIKIEADYITRRQVVCQFNTENRWKKRGLRFSFLRWAIVEPRYFDVNIAVYHGDGSVIITHGGIEMGQGINTKAAQVCAYLLNINLEKIQVKGTNTIVAPNAAVSGGSITSQNIIAGVQLACQELLKRLEPIKQKMKNAKWEEIIAEAFSLNIDLQAHGFVAPNLQNYNVYGVTLAEVEVDILTGETVVLRVDILQDAGQSVSPGIDVGQVESAFIMGLGYWMIENLVYDNKTGELLSDRTWNYHVPQARDIPLDFRVYLRKNSYNNKVILGSKAIGEPPICMAIAIPFAIREAITSARLDVGISTTTWFDIGSSKIEKPEISNSTSKNNDQNIVNYCSARTSKNSNVTLLQTIMLNVVYGNKTMTGKALYDNGSQRSYIKTEVAQKLDMKSSGKEVLNHALVHYGLQDGPFTIDKICMSAATKIEDFKFN